MFGLICFQNPDKQESNKGFEDAKFNPGQPNRIGLFVAMRPVRLTPIKKKREIRQRDRGSQNNLKHQPVKSNIDNG
jgi:hypothetical protein